MSITYNAAAYLRLSRDDKNGNSESMSIDNQRRIVSDYITEKGWNLTDVYIDDGFSGTNFDRPHFKKMIQDIESGKINCVVTKDLSRLGRNYSKVGYYTDEYFPEHNVRYIAINDTVDTVEGINDFSAFHNVINEYYPREISRKVRQVKKANAEKGMFMGSRAPYGYMKSPNDKHQLIIDEDAASIVRRIFQEFNNGDNGRLIAERLNHENVLCPRAYYYDKNGSTNPKKENMTWCSNTAIQIIDNPVYIGRMIQGKRQMISYKSKKRRLTPPDEWIVVENTHDPIISMEVWECAQKLRKMKQRIHTKKANSDEPVFSGLLQCADCGASLNGTLLCRNKVMTYRCGTYLGHGKSACASHSIREEVLEQIILKDIHTYARLAVEERDELIRQIILKKQQSELSNSSELKKQIISIENKVSDLQKTLASLYKDKALGNLPEAMCFSLMAEYQAELDSLLNKLPEMKREFQTIECAHSDAERWADIIPSYLDVHQLNRPLARALIDKIIVSDKKELNGQVFQDVKIIYKFVGCLQNNVNKTKDVA